MAEKKTIDDVKSFWESSPLWTGESEHEKGSKAFFDEHREVYIADCFGGKFDDRFLPGGGNRQARVLDLGCGIGFWTVEFGLLGYENLSSADLTAAALELAKNRCDVYGVKSNFSQQNAESMTFEDGSFDHVNCQGVVHHTPNTEQAIAEIARVIKKDGTASISVYYRNFFLRLWPIIRPIGKALYKLGAQLKGRGREGIFKEKDVDNIVRLYDGADNPIGKSYSKKEFQALLSKYFEIEEFYLHFFPARTLPFKVPKGFHRFLDKHFGFMIYATLKKAQ